MTAHFLDPLITQDLGGSRWLVTVPLRYYSEQYAGTYVVPAGFETDLASIPRPAWAIVPKSGRYNRAAVLHDACYAGVTDTETGIRQHVTKSIADELFREAMRADGVSRFLSWWMFSAVSLFGDADHRLLVERQAQLDQMMRGRGIHT